LSRLREKELREKEIPPSETSVVDWPVAPVTLTADQSTGGMWARLV